MSADNNTTSGVLRVIVNQHMIEDGQHLHVRAILYYVLMSRPISVIVREKWLRARCCLYGHNSIANGFIVNNIASNIVSNTVVSPWQPKTLGTKSRKIGIAIKKMSLIIFILLSISLSLLCNQYSHFIFVTMELEFQNIVFTYSTWSDCNTGTNFFICWKDYSDVIVYANYLLKTHQYVQGPNTLLEI